MSEPFVWYPGTDALEHSNIARFLRNVGMATYQDLLRRSIDDPVWFWGTVVRSLPIDFFTPYEQVVDLSHGAPWARWFTGGTINLSHNCVDRHSTSAARDRVALIWEGEDGEVRRWNFAELAYETDRAALALKRLGVTQGDRVGLFAPMLLETVAAFFAVAKLGAVVIPIFSGFGSRAVADRLNDAGAITLITTDGFYRKGKAVPMLAVANEALAESPTVRHQLVIERLSGQTLHQPGRDVWWHEALSAVAGPCPSEPMGAEAPVMIGYTSGTTGKPKGAVHVHAGFLVKLAQEVSHQVDLRVGDVLYWLTDMGWIMGPWEVIGGLALGGTVLLYEGAPDWPAPDRLWALAERHGVSILGISPTLVRSMMKHGEVPVRSHDLSRLRILGSTGEPWNPGPWHWLFEHVGGKRCPIINISGGTEVGACFLSPTPLTPLKACSLSGPALGMAMDVVDPEGRPLRGGVGELVCRKPWPGMTRGLWGDPDRYIQTYWSRWPDVWVHGDWASIDEDGCWSLHGRSDDTLKVAGKRLGPAEVESVLVGHADVAEAAAIGVPDPVKGETIWCYVVLRNPQAAGDSLVKDLEDLVAEAFGKSFTPSRVCFVAELPKTRNAKVLRRAIRAKALGKEPGDLSSLENPWALESIEKAIRTE